MNRFDLDQTTRELLNAAVALDVTDAVGLACLMSSVSIAGVTAGTSVAALIEIVLDELDTYANACQHSDPAKRSAWIQLREAVHYAKNDDPGKPDKFGFVAEARATTQAALVANAINSLVAS